MNSNWFKLVMKMTKIEYGKNLLLKGVPIIFNKGGAKLKIGENTTIKSSFLSNLVGLYSRTIIVTRAPGAEIEIGDNVGISGATIYARKKMPPTKCTKRILLKTRTGKITWEILPARPVRRSRGKWKCQKKAHRLKPALQPSPAWKATCIGSCAYLTLPSAKKILVNLLLAALVPRVT